MNIKYCPSCFRIYGAGMHLIADYCWCCECDTIEENISCNDVDDLYNALAHNKNDKEFFEFIQSMISLKEKDPIEYELKMSQFRTQAVQQKQAKAQSTPSNLPKCPRCGSTAITAGQRGYSLMWGFLGSGNTVNRCSNCGHKWKP